MKAEVYILPINEYLEPYLKETTDTHIPEEILKVISVTPSVEETDEEFFYKLDHERPLIVNNLYSTESIPNVLRWRVVPDDEQSKKIDIARRLHQLLVRMQERWAKEDDDGRGD